MTLDSIESYEGGVDVGRRRWEGASRVVVLEKERHYQWGCAASNGTKCKERCHPTEAVESADKERPRRARGMVDPRSLLTLLYSHCPTSGGNTVFVQGTQHVEQNNGMGLWHEQTFREIL